MDIKQVLKFGCFLPDLKGNTKEDIIEEMIDHLLDAGKINNRQAALDSVLEREKKMSTGMQGGVAIPHGKTNTVKELIVVIALKKDGVDFNAIDRQPSNIFVMTLSPVNCTGSHMQYLAEISKLLNCPNVRKKLLNTKEIEDVLKLLTD